MTMHAGRAGMRSMQRDRSLLEHRIKRGTLARVVVFARPYRGVLVVFLGAVVLDAVVSSVSPLVLRAIIDDAPSSPSAWAARCTSRPGSDRVRAMD